MSQNGFGTISNEVEIEQMYNANGEEDLNTDNDISKADVIIGVRTGKMVLYVTLTLMVLAILALYSCIGPTPLKTLSGKNLSV